MLARSDDIDVVSLSGALQRHTQAFAALSATPEWQRLIAIEAAIGELEALITPPAEPTAPPAA